MNNHLLAPPLMPDSWDREGAVNVAGAMYRNSAVASVAKVMVASHPYALDYLKQAPVLALAYSKAGAITSREKLYIAENFGGKCERGAKLRDLMASYGFAYQLRAICPYALHPMRRSVLKRLGHMPPSALAQAIPEKPGQQDTWLQALVCWTQHAARRWPNRSEVHFEWAARASHAVPKGAARGVVDICDFAMEDGRKFNPLWTLDQARAAAEQWHRELAGRESEERFLREHGLGFRDVIGFGTSPTDTIVDGYRFLALQTGEDLYIEGRAMHHCVASYTRSVVGGASRIYSIRDAEGRRVATIEYAAEPGGAYRPTQMRGPCNSRWFPRRLGDAANKFSLVMGGCRRPRKRAAA